MMGNMKKILTNLGQPDPCVTVDEAIYQLTKQVHWIVRSLEYITLRLGRFHRAKHFWGIIIKRMRASSFKNIIAASKLYGSNQIEGTHFSFVIENLYVSEFLTLIFSQKVSSFVKALHVGFHGKFQDKFLLCNVNVFFTCTKSILKFVSMLILLTPLLFEV